MIKHFKNGNIHIRIEKNDVGIDVVEKLYYNYVLYPVGDEYCISNYMSAQDWCYNGGMDYYCITSRDLYFLELGKTIILYPHDEAYINEYFLEEAL